MAQEQHSMERRSLGHNMTMHSNVNGRDDGSSGPQLVMRRRQSLHKLPTMQKLVSSKSPSCQLTKQTMRPPTFDVPLPSGCFS